MRRLAVASQDRRDLNVPGARHAPGGIGGTSKARGAPRPRGFDALPGVRISGTGPQIRPRTALQRAEIFHLHDPLAAFAHELQAALEVQYLDAVSAAPKK